MPPREPVDATPLVEPVDTEEPVETVSPVEPVQTTDVLIVGAGIAGIAVADELIRTGIDVLLVERGADVGGTWRDNVYPGVACDIPSALYAFERHPNPGWTRRFAAGAEIQAYLRRVAASTGVTARTRFGTDACDLAWQEDRGMWRTETSRGVLESRFVVMAVGRLSEPRIPALRGVEGFTGRILHSSRFEPGLDLAGLRVGVVGSGASAVQLLPRIAASAASTVLFQRTPSWIVPRGDAAVPLTDRMRFRLDPALLARRRADLFEAFEAGHAARRSAGPERDRLRTTALDHLAHQVPDPALRIALTPTDEIGCRRVLLSDDFYPTLATGRAILEPSALTGFDGGRAVAASGAHYDLDVIVLATGFHATEPPFARLVQGEHGRTLAEHWSEGMTAWASTMAAGFPNLFVVDGPNAALGHNSAVHMIESQAEFVAALIADAGDEPLVPTMQAERAWTEELDTAADGTVWLSGCRSWYVDERSGRLTLLWPGTASAYRERLRAAVGELDTARAPGASQESPRALAHT